jgi:hypothetical protein
VPSKRPCLGEAHLRVSNTVFGRLVAARCGTGSARGPGVDSVYSTPRHGAAGPAVVTVSQPPASPPAAVADRGRPGPARRRRGAEPRGSDSDHADCHWGHIISQRRRAPRNRGALLRLSRIVLYWGCGQYHLYSRSGTLNRAAQRCRSGDSGPAGRRCRALQATPSGKNAVCMPRALMMHVTCASFARGARPAFDVWPWTRR